MPLDAYVFGTATGDRVRQITHSWWTTVLRAHGYEGPIWKHLKLYDDAKAALKRIDLHFHDLRREAGSRWLELGVKLHTVRDWLGHTSISQTSTYLASTLQVQHDAMRRFEEERARLQTADSLAVEAYLFGRGDISASRPHSPVTLPCTSAVSERDCARPNSGGLA
jgi:hypothetical protein